MMRKLILVGLLAYVGVIHADNCRVGEVTRLSGQVEVERAGQKMTPATGFKVCRGDLFRTGGGSVADVRLRDGTRLTVGKDSELVIREFRIFKRQPNLAFFDLLKGAFRSITGSITQRPHRYEVKTSVATIGVRGTDFWGGFGVSPDGALDVIMLDGHGVYVKTESGQVELDKPGLGTTVKVGGLPGDAKAWPEDKVKRAVATVTAD